MLIVGGILQKRMHMRLKVLDTSVHGQYMSPLKDVASAKDIIAAIWDY